MAHNVAVGLYGMTHWLFIWHGEGGGVVAHYVAEGSNGARQWLTLCQGDSSVTLSQPPPAGWGNGSLLGKGGAQCGQGVPAGQGLELTIWQGGVEGGGVGGERLTIWQNRSVSDGARKEGGAKRSRDSTLLRQRPIRRGRQQRGGGAQPIGRRRLGRRPTASRPIPAQTGGGRWPMGPAWGRGLWLREGASQQGRCSSAHKP